MTRSSGKKRPDHSAIEQAIVHKEKELRTHLTISTIAEGSGLSVASVKRLLYNSDSHGYDTYRQLGKFLDREPKCLWKHAIPVLKGGSPVQSALTTFAELLHDGKISWSKGQDLGEALMLGAIPEMRGFALSVHQWEELFEHLTRRGHLYRRFDGTLEPGRPTPKKLLELIRVRTKFECWLVDQFVARDEYDQKAIVTSMRQAYELCSAELVRGRESHFVDKETQVHLCWCHENHDLRDVFALMLKRSRQIADFLLIERLNHRNPDGYDFIEQLNEMPGEWSTIIETIEAYPNDAEKIKKQVKLHMKRSELMVEQIAYHEKRRGRRS
ncbi:hypothetical protein NHH03_14125 [Stieleria sp. TO1_6]|uniref:hypothetical protein n=1 Tax=Stieleria tagensis TaxID=2956795 RepID=UPI00209B7429|nr:hypothetical protein [Stieleria tagensis]MCO8122881.1 hypothetical protein [Stieleria tagensis]